MKFKEMENFSTNEEKEDVNKTQRNLIKDDLINNVIKNRIKKEKKINHGLTILYILILIIIISSLVIYIINQKKISKKKQFKIDIYKDNRRYNKINYEKRKNTKQSINSNNNTKVYESKIDRIEIGYNPIGKAESVRRGKKFFEACMNNVLINKKSFSKEENPFISVVIPVYDAGDKISKSVISAQNQNVANIEIILVNDASNNETYIIIKKLEKEDPRILLINNKKNMGTLYSRCIGALKSNGKYIFPLDNDDLFFDEDVLDVASKIAKEGNYDIVEFKGAERYKYNSFSNYFRDSEYSNHENNLALYQPELGQYARRKNNVFGIYDVFLWAKCIDSEVYKQTINLMGEETYKYKIIWGEDLITSFVLFRTAKSFKFINKYGISRFKSKSTRSNNTPRQMYYLSLILYIKILLKFTENNFHDKELLVHETLSFIRIKKFLNAENKNILKELLKLILENNYISNIEKGRIRRYGEYYMK